MKLTFIYHHAIKLRQRSTFKLINEISMKVRMVVGEEETEEGCDIAREAIEVSTNYQIAEDNI